MDAKRGFGRILLMSVVACSGCQSWSGANYPMQGQTRVPPPGTGTYQLPNGYYNNTSAVAPTGQVMQAGFSSGPQLPNGALPSTNLTAQSNAYDASPGASNSTNTAQFTAPSAGSGNFSTNGATNGVSSASFNATTVNSPAASPSFGGNYSASASLNDSPGGEAPSLQWQQ